MTASTTPDATATAAATAAAATADATAPPDAADSGYRTTGWEPDVPAGDSMLRRFLLCSAAVADTFAGAAGGRTVRTDTYAAADYGRPSGFFNAATLLAPPAGPDGWDAVLDDVEAFFGFDSGARAAGGTGVTVLWSAWPTPDLRSRGWRLEGHPPLLIRPPAAAVEPGSEPAGEPVVEDVTDAAGLTEWERVAVEGYPLDELLPARPGVLADPVLLDDPRLRFAVGRAASGQAVSIGTLFVDDGLGCFTLGVTRPEARGQGHWRAHAVRRLLAAPDIWMTGVFSDYSRPLAERLGFVPVLRLTLWTRSRERTPID